LDDTSGALHFEVVEYGIVRPFEPQPLDRRILDHVGEFPRELFTDVLYQANEAMENYALRWSVELVEILELEPLLETPRDALGLVEARAFSSAIAPALGCLLRTLAGKGLVETLHEDDGPRFALSRPLPNPDLSHSRSRMLELMPGLEPAVELADVAGHAHLPVAKGEISGREAVLGAGQAGLWCRYFSNDNPAYLLNNRLAAEAAANRLPPSRPLTILEIGGGAGSATEALLTALADRGQQTDIKDLAFTEPSPFFRRRAARALDRRLPPGTMSFSDLDMNQTWVNQGVAPGSLDLVFAVNVLHVAKDLAFTLGQARGALRPGGWLVAGEALRPFPESSLQAEMVFCLLEDFVQVRTDPGFRPRFGFLTPEEWTRALTTCGFSEVRILPDLEKIRTIYPRFFSGVVCGRSPL
jgi:SAM-dependent methyltransferase